MGNSSSSGVFPFIDKTARSLLNSSKTKYTITINNTTKTIEYTIPLKKDDILTYSFLQVNKASFFQTYFDVLINTQLAVQLVTATTSNKDITTVVNNFKKSVLNYVKSKTGNVVYNSINYTKDDSSDYQLIFTNLPIDTTSAYILIYKITPAVVPKVTPVEIAVYIEANDTPVIIVNNDTEQLSTTVNYSNNIIKKEIINNSLTSKNEPINKNLNLKKFVFNQ